MSCRRALQAAVTCQVASDLSANQLVECSVQPVIDRQLMLGSLFLELGVQVFRTDCFKGSKRLMDACVGGETVFVTALWLGICMIYGE